MSSVKTEKYSDEVITIAIPKIKLNYADVTLEELKNATPEHLPNEIILELNIAQKFVDIRDNGIVIPLGSLTLSEDGKTCSECNSKLIEKTSTISDSAGVRTKQVLVCPKKCNRLAIKMNKAKDELQDLLQKQKKAVEESEFTFTVNTRNSPVTREILYLKSNLENGFKVTAPNDQFTELVYGTTVQFERDEKLVKKVGKVIEFRECEHELDERVKAINESILYNLIRVEKIGNLGVTEHNTQSSCAKCRRIGCDIERKLFDEDLYHEEYDNPKKYKLIHSMGKDVVTYRITVQRVDVELPSYILEALDDDRFNLKNYRYLSASDITSEVRSLTYIGVPDNFKSKIVGQLKTLANNNKIERKTEEFEFAEHRQDNAWQSTHNDTWHKNQDYVGGATKLNFYRANDNNAIYITKQVRKEIKRMIQMRKDKGYSGNEWSFDNSMYLIEIWHTINKNLGMTRENQNDFHINWNTATGQIFIACLSGIKRPKRRSGY